MSWIPANGNLFAGLDRKTPLRVPIWACVRFGSIIVMGTSVQHTNSQEVDNNFSEEGEVGETALLSFHQFMLTSVG